ncbi:MAG TPA: hypothetical protein PLX55_02075 [bacterium]|nr:hypothetical protein [bacterium]
MYFIFSLSPRMHFTVIVFPLFLFKELGQFYVSFYGLSTTFNHIMQYYIIMEYNGKSVKMKSYLRGVKRKLSTVALNKKKGADL